MKLSIALTCAVAALLIACSSEPTPPLPSPTVNTPTEAEASPVITATLPLPSPTEHEASEPASSSSEGAGTAQLAEPTTLLEPSVDPTRPTPAPIDETRVMELSTDIHVTDVFGDAVVGFDHGGELWLINIRTGDSRQLTDDGHPKYSGAALSDDYVAWIDERRMMQLPGYPPESPVFSQDVYVRNRHTGEERRITGAPASRHGLRMWSPPRLAGQSQWAAGRPPA